MPYAERIDGVVSDLNLKARFSMKAQGKRLTGRLAGAILAGELNATRPRPTNSKALLSVAGEPLSSINCDSCIQGLRRIVLCVGYPVMIEAQRRRGTGYTN
jgi:hypothetical protein